MKATVAMGRASRLLVGLAVVSVALIAAACGRDAKAASSSSGATSTTSTAVSTTTGSRSLAEFAAAADAVCIATFPKVNALPDPDGVGGNKQLGLGRVVRDWADGLAAITPPDAIADDWAKATGLLRRSGVRLDDAERLAAEGAAAGSGAAHSEALWSLQARAAEIISELGIPFKACFVE
jgi:hypothetical protein